jgi:hypothetical protein
MLKNLLNILKNKYFLNLIYLADYSNMPKSAKEPLTFANMLYNFSMVGNGRFRDGIWDDIWEWNFNFIQMLWRMGRDGMDEFP